MRFPQRVTVDEQIARADAEGWNYGGDMSTEGEVLDLLYSLVRVQRPEVCVETGTYHGHGTLAIAKALDKNERGHLWTVENYDLYEYAGHDRVTHVYADSVVWSDQLDTNAPEEAVDFAFVDCGEPDGRLEVFRNMLKHMRKGGLIAVHDTRFYDDQFLDALNAATGFPGFTFPALNGLTIWRIK